MGWEAVVTKEVARFVFSDHVVCAEKRIRRSTASWE